MRLSAHASAFRMPSETLVPSAWFHTTSTVSSYPPGHGLVASRCRSWGSSRFWPDGLSREADARLDHEADLSVAQPVGERMPFAPGQDHAEMTDRHVFAIDLVGACLASFLGFQVGDDLMAEKVEIDPVGTGTPLGTAQHVTVKGARGGKVVNREGDMKWRQAGHGGESCIDSAR